VTRSNFAPHDPFPIIRSNDLAVVVGAQSAPANADASFPAVPANTNMFLADGELDLSLPANMGRVRGRGRLLKTHTGYDGCLTGGRELLNATSFSADQKFERFLQLNDGCLKSIVR
jgi:hypothetical protein